MNDPNETVLEGIKCARCREIQISLNNHLHRDHPGDSGVIISFKTGRKWTIIVLVLGISLGFWLGKVV